MSPPINQSHWFRRNRSIFVVGAIVGLLVLIQWPMFKGIFYRVAGTPAPDDGIPWRRDLAAASAEARQSGKPLLVDFSATWCPPCQVMKHDVWPDPKVREAVLAGYIPVLVDVDADRDLAARYGISSIPTILILDADGKVLRTGSFMSASALVEFLTRKTS